MHTSELLNAFLENILAFQEGICPTGLLVNRPEVNLLPFLWHFQRAKWADGYFALYQHGLVDTRQAL